MLIFGFTWDGFFLKSNYGNVAPDEQGYITIDSENDIQVIDGQGTERIKIGRLGQIYVWYKIFRQWRRASNGY